MRFVTRQLNQQPCCKYARAASLPFHVVASRSVGGASFREDVGHCNRATTLSRNDRLQTGCLRSRLNAIDTEDLALLGLFPTRLAVEAG